MKMGRKNGWLADLCPAVVWTSSGMRSRNNNPLLPLARPRPAARYQVYNVRKDIHVAWGSPEEHLSSLWNE